METQQHEPGVYFGMPFEEYVNDPALSYSGIKHLLISPLTYWVRSGMNPKRVDNSTPAKEFGHLFHHRVLFGYEDFCRLHRALPAKEDFPNLLDGVEALRERCGWFGLKKSGTLLEMAERIIENDPGAQLWPIILRDFHANLPPGGKVIKSETADQIEAMAGMIEAHPMGRQVFQYGSPEVSIFWIHEETGCRMKARVDYLREKETVDIKTFSNVMEVDTNQAVIRAIANRKYHIQAAVYFDAVQAAKGLIRQGAVFGQPNHALCTGLVNRMQEPPRFFFLFIESGEANNLVIKEIPSQGLIFSTGQGLYKKGVKTFMDCSSRFGAAPWVDTTKYTVLKDHEFPAYALLEED
ncbi:MAG: PD-(D/E)XK nuclease-like domain-containing protein [Magnetococcales bacterium]|nr:PD-(D/E)XK nuclease-like domain-containing protein [Magnetococcales bacterium]